MTDDEIGTIFGIPVRIVDMHMIPTIAVGVGGIATMTATMIKLPDGTEQDASEVICEGCDKPVSDHSCGSTFTVTSGAAAAPVRSSGRKKDPTEIQTCPHCGGRLHMNLPTATVNFECFMRQYYVDKGIITEPVTQRLPVWTLDELKDAIAWADTLATPITYGKMASAAGGAGTYAATRPKADPKPAGERPKKRKAADKGERIEDLAASVEADEPDVDDGDDLGGAAVAAADPTPRKSKKSRKNRVSKINSDGTVESVDLEEAVASGAVKVGSVEQVPDVDADAERERKRAERRAILAGSR